MRNLLTTLFLALSLTACAPQPTADETEPPQVEIDDGGTVRSFCLNCVFGCQTNSQCAAGEYCQKSDGQCGSYGLCQPIPTGLCGSFGGSLGYWCGCDGVTYPGKCFAAKAGTNIAHYGRCR